MKKRDTKEERVVEHSSLIIKDLKRLYDNDGLAVLEYIKLFEAYKKLARRFDKTIRLNDNMGKSVITNNESLKDTVDYTIKTAREKLLYNVSEHRKTKESLSKTLEVEKSSTKSLQIKLELAYQRIFQLEEEIKKLKNGTAVENSFEEQFEPNPKIEINLEPFRDYSFGELFEQELLKADEQKKEFHSVKLTIDNFDKIKRDIEESGNISNFLKGNVKFIFTTLQKEALVFFSHLNIFYIIYLGVTKDELTKKLEKLMGKRALGANSITLSMGVSTFKNGDDFDSILKRCDIANSKASLEKTKSSMEFEI